LPLPQAAATITGGPTAYQRTKTPLPTIIRDEKHEVVFPFEELDLRFP
jgi:hypothetical protein